MFAKLPPERQWMRPYLRVGFATACAGAAFLFGFIILLQTVTPENFLLEDTFIVCGAVLMGLTPVVLFLAARRAKKMRRSVSAAPPE